MICHRCDGDGKAHGSDRPFEWTPERGYPGPCPVCNGSGIENCCEGEQAQSEALTTEQLITRGGHFYKMGHDAWCDTALDSYKLIPGVGYIKQECA